ncbi:copper amine oxidase [Vibrio tubiashii]|nr:copper amine oxidase [Vibrio tubiashii]
MNKTALTLASLALLSSHAFAADVINHKSPYCGCCTEWTKHMQEAGFNVEEKLHENMNPIKQQFGITPELASCHTAVIDGYVFEGHIPAQDIKAFLDNPPRNAKGLAVPGMPMGSPGMEYGNKQDEYSVYAFNEQGQVFEYRHYQGK